MSIETYGWLSHINDDQFTERVPVFQHYITHQNGVYYNFHGFEQSFKDQIFDYILRKNTEVMVTSQQWRRSVNDVTELPLSNQRSATVNLINTKSTGINTKHDSNLTQGARLTKQLDQRLQGFSGV